MSFVILDFNFVIFGMSFKYQMVYSEITHRILLTFIHFSHIGKIVQFLHTLRPPSRLLHFQIFIWHLRVKKNRKVTHHFLNKSFAQIPQISYFLSLL